MDSKLKLQTALGEVTVHVDSEMDSHTFKTIYTGSVEGHRIWVQADSVEQVIEEIHKSIAVQLANDNH
jgi:hypothetical protein